MTLRESVTVTNDKEWSTCTCSMVLSRVYSLAVRILATDENSTVLVRMVWNTVAYLRCGRYGMYPGCHLKKAPLSSFYESQTRHPRIVKKEFSTDVWSGFDYQVEKHKHSQIVKPLIYISLGKNKVLGTTWPHTSQCHCSVPTGTIIPFSCAN